MDRKRILLIAGTRPNFIKIAPLYHTLSAEKDITVEVCHTGQHFDRNMSAVFWECLELPEPDYQLNISGSDVPDTIGKTILGLNPVLKENPFDLVIVVGDVNATVAGAITAAQAGIRVMHVESGLRSFDRRMPEEINRVITDHLSDFLMVSEDSGLVNLKKEGIPEDRVFYVGNLMIESLIRTKPRWEDIPLPAAILPVTGRSFILATFHRPENVDEKTNLEILLGHLNEISIHYPILFPIHPRTRNRIRVFDLGGYLENKNIIFCDPLGYFEFIKLINLSAIVLTDSGGIQEETTYLKIPCLTVRNNTERPSTLRQGTNRLIRLQENNWLQKIEDHQINLKKNRPEPIRFWDDQVSHRILEVIQKVLK